MEDTGPKTADILPSMMNRKRENGAVRSELGLVPLTVLTITVAAGSLLLPEQARAQAPQVGWAAQLSGPYRDAPYAQASALDKDDNMYVAGMFTSTNFSMGSRTLTNLNALAGTWEGPNGFIAKVNSSGEVLWLQMIGGDFWTEINACATDGSGNVYVTGQNQSTNAVFGTNVFSNPSAPQFFLAKFDAQGNLLWVRQAADSADGWGGYGTGLIVAGDGTVRVAGTFMAPTLVFGTNVITSANATNYLFNDFVVSYSASGDALWAKGIEQAIAGQAIPAVGVDSQGNTYLSDRFYGYADFGGIRLPTSAGTNTSSMYLASYDQTGNLSWAREVVSSPAFIDCGGMAVDPQGNCHIVATYYVTNLVCETQTLPLIPGPNGNTFAAKYDNTGNLIWANAMSGSSYYSGTNYNYARNVALDGAGNCYAVVNSANGGGVGAIVAIKFAANGNLLWARPLASEASPMISFGSVDSRGSLFLIGAVLGGGSFNLDSITLPAPGTGYYFAARLDGPALSLESLGNQVVIAWPTNAVGLKLESTTDLSSGIWSPVTIEPVMNGNQYNVTDSITNASVFYRLRNF